MPFVGFFLHLRQLGLPVSLSEYLQLLQALQRGLGIGSVEDFYRLSRTLLVKDEKHLDRFDLAFAAFFEAAAQLPDDAVARIPEEWLRAAGVLELSEEEKQRIEALGGWQALQERFRQLLAEQQERHAGGNRWIGTGGTSPFGANGYNPEGYRIGQAGSRHRSAVKVWDQRSFSDYDDQLELNTRSFQIALRRLRHFTREGAAEELDLEQTIAETSRQGGLLHLQMRPERRNRIRLLVLMDVGGSMDDHIQRSSELFSALRHQFQQLEFYYFHNCVYESLWRANSRRHSERLPTLELLRRYDRRYKLLLIGDAAMSPYELTFVGGSVEHHNDEPGERWLQRLRAQYPAMAWVNPLPESSWPYYKSVTMIRTLLDQRMYPLTVAGLVAATRELMRSQKPRPMPLESLP